MYPEKDPIYLNQLSAWMHEHSFLGKVIALNLTDKKWIKNPFESIMDLSEIHFKMSQNTPHRMGSFIESDDGTGVMFAKSGESGVLFFGPYIPLHSGKYRVVFKIDAQGDPFEQKIYGTVDINRVKKGQITLKKLYLDKPEISRNYEVVFDVSNPIKAEDVYEFRVVSLGTADMTLKEIILFKLL